MLDEKLIRLVSSFKRVCIQATAGLPQHELDMTWPSFGSLDMLTFPLRFRQQYTPADMNSIHGAAMYIAGLAYDCWSNFPDKLHIELKPAPGTEYDILLTAQGGKMMEPHESVKINVSKALRDLLQQPPRQFPLMYKATRQIHPYQNIISPFAISIMAGTSEAIEGPWKLVKAEQFRSYTLVAENLLAISSAQYYKRVHPHEEIGQSPELYKNRLIFPPAGYDEPFQCCKAVSAVMSYFKRLNLAHDEITDIALNLGGSPDETISNVGFAIAAANSGARPSSRLLGIAASKEHFAAELRPAVMVARETFGKVEDWLTALDKGDHQTALQYVDVEKRLGLLPLLWFSVKHILNPAFRTVLDPIVWADPRGTIDEIEKLERGGSAPDDLLLQKIFLWISWNEVEEAEKALQQFSASRMRDYAEPYNFFELQGLLAAHKGSHEQAVRFFEKAASYKIDDPHRKLRINGNYVWSLVMARRHSDALRVLDGILTTDPAHVTQRLNRASALQAFGEDDEAIKEIEELAEYAFLDRRVFANFVSRKQPAPDPQEPPPIESKAKKKAVASAYKPEDDNSSYAPPEPDDPNYDDKDDK
jgi:hypothetical protein